MDLLALVAGRRQTLPGQRGPGARDALHEVEKASVRAGGKKVMQGAHHLKATAPRERDRRGAERLCVAVQVDHGGRRVGGPQDLRHGFARRAVPHALHRHHWMANHVQKLGLVEADDLDVAGCELRAERADRTEEDHAQPECAERDGLFDRDLGRAALHVGEVIDDNDGLTSRLALERGRFRHALGGRPEIVHMQGDALSATARVPDRTFVPQASEALIGRHPSSPIQKIGLREKLGVQIDCQ